MPLTVICLATWRWTDNLRICFLTNMLKTWIIQSPLSKGKNLHTQFSQLWSASMKSRHVTRMWNQLSVSQIQRFGNPRMSWRVLQNAAHNGYGLLNLSLWHSLSEKFDQTGRANFKSATVLIESWFLGMHGWFLGMKVAEQGMYWVIRSSLNSTRCICTRP